jgi:hypothetical protein
MHPLTIRLLPTLALSVTLALASFTATAQSYQVAPVDGGGKIEGKVTFLGEVPIKKIVPNKDVEVCGGPRDEPQMTVGADKGVKDVIIYLKGVAKGKDWPKQDKPPTLDQEKCVFKTVAQVMHPGEFNIVNSDPVLHTTHGYYGGRNAFNIAIPEKGITVKRALPIPGLIRIQCDTHNWMHSQLLVAENPYYAVTAADGTFSIGDVPPGTYTLVAFQRYTGPLETPVTIKGGDAVKLPIELKK